MNPTIPTTRPGASGQLSAHIMLVAQLGLALTAVAALAFWQFGGDDGKTTPHAAPATARAVMSAAAPQPPPVYYLVSSEADKASLVQAVSAQATDALTVTPDYVIVSHDQQVVDQVMQRFIIENQIRFSAGLPEARVIDLRTVTN